MMSITELAYPPASNTLSLLEWPNQIPSLRALCFEIDCFILLEIKSSRDLSLYATRAFLSNSDML